MRKKIITIGVIIFLVLLAVIFLMLPRNKLVVSEVEPSTRKTADLSPSVQADDVVFPVKVVLVHKGDLIHSINSSGYAYPRMENEIKPKLGGQAVEVNVYNGKAVHKGDILFLLDDRELQIALQEAEDQLINAQVDYKLANSGAVDTTGESKYRHQLDSLGRAYNEAELKSKSGEVSQTVLDRIRRNYDAISIFTSVNREDVVANKVGLDRAGLEYEDAKLRLSYATINAPFDGVAADCAVQPGSYVQASQTCMRVIDISRIRINCEVTETDLSKIKVGDEAKAQFVAFAESTFEGMVVQINPIVDLQKRTATVVVEIANSSMAIKPGMYAAVRIASDVDRDIVLVPKSAVLFRDNRPLVFTVLNGESQWIYVNLGKMSREAGSRYAGNDDFYEIKDGLLKGDTLVIDGNYNLAHQAKVKVTEVTQY